ncbi:MAG: hypothetical protein ACD_13C00073G0001 [uncultured bacterium]|nr:MAG: hypothetical protein ACD_13C00073G0001 [uncultured bacterium]
MFISSRPSGFLRPAAVLAKKIFGPMPMETVIQSPTSFLINSFISTPTFLIPFLKEGQPSRLTINSSMDFGITTLENLLRTVRSFRWTSRYFRGSGVRTVRPGARNFPSLTRIPVLTPSAFAS